MKEKEVVITNLNEFLRGQYMGIHIYEHYIGKVEDTNVKKVFQSIQQDHKNHALQVAERIQNLGGTPDDDEGMMGSIQSYMSKFMIPDTKEGMIEKVLKGQSKYGVELSEEIVKGDLDSESKTLIESILDEDRKNVQNLKHLLANKNDL